MRLVIDAVGTKMGGGAFVLQDVIAAALRHPRVTDVVAFTSPAHVRAFNLALRPRLMERPQPLAERSGAMRLWWSQVGMARAAHSVGAQATLCLTGISLPPPRVRSANFIQQSLPFEQPLSGSRRVRLRLELQRHLMGSASRRSSLTFVQTATMKRCIEAAFRLETARVQVYLPTARALGAPHALLATMRQTAPGHRILWTGYSGAHKNLPVLEQALRHLAVRLPQARLFVGAPAGTVASLPNVVQLGELDGESLATAYTLADALVMPSTVETVGLSLVEALAFGLPIVAADRGYAHDVCEDAALYFDPARADACAEQLVTLLESSALRAQLGERGRALNARRVAAPPYDRMIASLIE